MEKEPYLKAWCEWPSFTSLLFKILSKGLVKEEIKTLECGYSLEMLIICFKKQKGLIKMSKHFARNCKWISWNWTDPQPPDHCIRSIFHVCFFPCIKDTVHAGQWVSRPLLLILARILARKPTRLLCPWDFPGSTEVDCHFLLQKASLKNFQPIADHNFVKYCQNELLGKWNEKTI